VYIAKRRVNYAIVFAALVAQQVGAFQNPKLSQSQIEQLVAIATPDTVIAEEITDRGLDFEPTQRIIEDLRKRGAGLRTLATLRNLIRYATLEIEAQPRSEVVVDEAELGRTDAQGVIVVHDLSAGAHQVVVRKADYREERTRIELSNGEYKRLRVQLEWAGGFLTVRADVPASAVVIEGLGTFTGSVSDLPCSPGTYSVTATHPGMRMESQTITVAPGQHAVAEIHFAPDPEFLNRQLINAVDQLEGNNPTAAIQTAEGVLAIDANNLPARALIAAAYFDAHDTQHFRTSSSEALRRGGLVPVDLLHVHTFPRKYIHSTTLTISTKTIAYNPNLSGGRCNTAPFSVPLQKIQSIETKRNEGGEVLLVLKVGDPRSSSKVMTLNFAGPGSSVVAPQGTILAIGNVTHIDSPAVASEMLEAVVDVVRNAFKRIQ
jgi:hypothetical protein